MSSTCYVAAVWGPSGAPTAVGRWRVDWHLVLLGVIVCLAIGLRTHGLGARSLWADEFLSLECSDGWGRSDRSVASTPGAAPDLVTLGNARPWTAIWPAVAQDENHPPLYFVLLRFWRDAFGDGEAALRASSVAAAAVAILLLYAVGVTMVGPEAALWACLLMAVASPQIRESQDARAYMPMTAIALAAMLAVVRINRRGPTVPRAVGLFLATLALPLIHYMALATVGGILVYAALALRGSRRRTVLLACGAALAVFGLAWGPSLLGQHQRMLSETRWLVDTAGGHVASTWVNLCVAPLRLFVDPGTATPLICAGGLAALLLPLLGVRRHPPLLLGWTWLVAPIASALVIDLAYHRQSLTMTKYAIAAAPAAYLMLGWLAAEGKRLGTVATAGVVLGATLCLPSDYDAGEPDWRPLASFVYQHSGPHDPLVILRGDGDVGSAGRLLSMTYYLGGANRRGIYVLDAPPTGRVLAVLRQANHVCILSSGIDWPTATRFLAGLRVGHAELFPGLAIAATADRPAPLSRLPTPLVNGPGSATALARPGGTDLHPHG